MEIFTLVTGLAYVVLEIRQKNAMWVLGIFTALASMIVFFRQGLYAFFGLQVYYFLISFWGFYQWRKDEKVAGQSLIDRNPLNREQGGNENPHRVRDDRREAIHLNRLNWKVAVISAVIGAVAFVGVALLMQRLYDPRPCLDAAVTVLGAIATWWLGRSYIEQWWLLVAANLLTVLMFVLQGSWWMTVLYMAYVAASVYGLMHWKKNGIYI